MKTTNNSIALKNGTTMKSIIIAFFAVIAFQTAFAAEGTHEKSLMQWPSALDLNNGQTIQEESPSLKLEALRLEISEHSFFVLSKEASPELALQELRLDISGEFQSPLFTQNAFDTDGISSEMMMQLDRTQE